MPREPPVTRATLWVKLDIGSPSGFCVDPSDYLSDVIFFQSDSVLGDYQLFPKGMRIVSIEEPNRTDGVAVTRTKWSA